jgi:predicted naringenin-chalcone synthase
MGKEAVQHWCIHPGGRRILDAIQKSNGLEEGSLATAHEVLQEYGNMSSPTILFVLKKLLDNKVNGNIFGAAFGPGLTMETFIATSHA